MKKLISLMGLVAVVLFGLSSCKPDDEPKFTTHLNTGHSAVGRLYGMDGFVEDPDDAQGIVFAVSPQGDSAYLVAFTDLMTPARVVYPKPEGGMFYGYTFFAQTMAWSKNLFEAGATNKDGAVNTDLIIKADTLNGGTAAKECREYFKRAYKDVLEDDYENDTQWAETQGFWYLPSMEELAALMKVKDRINQKYLQGEPASDAANKIYFQAIGYKPNLDLDGKNVAFAYWSSTEHGRQYAWYDLPDSNDDNYVPKTWDDEGGEGRIYVRPIRKVELK